MSNQIIFGTGGWRAVIGDLFTRENIQRVALALASRMKRERCAEEGFCIGYDRRFLSREVAIWFSEVMAAEKSHTYFVNLSAPTPQIMFTVKDMNLPYGAAVTASHNPAIYNGIKIFTRGGRDAVKEITDELQAAANAVEPGSVGIVPFEKALAENLVEFIDPRDRYIDSIIQRIDINAIRARRPRVVLDPMFGVSLTGLLTILYTARCDVNVIHDDHDAFFGGKLPAPTVDTLYELKAEVLDHHALVGIATDGDADRLGIIDEKGHYVSANKVLALLYWYLLKYKGWRGPAVRNLATTHLLDRVAAAFGQECIEVPVGFKYISEGMDNHDALIGGESSGGLTVRGHISGKDGLYAASLLVEMICVTGKPISQLVEELYREFGELHAVERDWALTEEQKQSIQARVMDAHELPEFGVPVDHVSYMDGCKVYFDKGWIVIRFSGTEPRIRIFAEYETHETAERLVRIMADELGLD